MSIYENCITHFCCWKESTLPCSLISILINHKFSFFKVKISFLIHLSFDYYIPKKSVDKNSDAYKQIIEGNLLVQH